MQNKLSSCVCTHTVVKEYLSLSIYIYVCVCVCVWVYIYIHIHICMYVCLRVYTSAKETLFIHRKRNISYLTLIFYTNLQIVNKRPVIFGIYFLIKFLEVVFIANIFEPTIQLSKTTCSTYKEQKIKRREGLVISKIKYDSTSASYGEALLMNIFLYFRCEKHLFKSSSSTAVCW